MSVFVDAGTTYTKIITVNEINSDLLPYLHHEFEDKKYFLLPSKLFRSLNINITNSCGHMGSASENEIVALANGALHIVDDDATILDLGSRDAKWIKFKNKKFSDMDWNTSCASSTGATVEMLLKFYDIKTDELNFCDEKYIVNCGIFGLEKIMDDIASGTAPNVAVSKFIHGIAYNAWSFSKKPNKIYLSGGFCNNNCFLDSLKHYCEVISLGQFVLCEGLMNE